MMTKGIPGRVFMDVQPVEGVFIHIPRLEVSVKAGPDLEVKVVRKHLMLPTDEGFQSKMRELAQTMGNLIPSSLKF